MDVAVQAGAFCACEDWSDQTFVYNSVIARSLTFHFIHFDEAYIGIGGIQSHVAYRVIFLDDRLFF